MSPVAGSQTSASEGGGGPLTGLRVLELGGIGAVPFAAMWLADHGADVIRVVAPSSLGERPNPVLDRGRRSLCLDLRTADGARAARRLAATVDVVLEGFRPGVLERLGLGPDVLHGERPELVIGRLTGYGQEGPLAKAAGHDINYISLSGVLDGIGRRDSGPVPPQNLVGDLGGGAMMLVSGVLAALFAAARTGRGQVVDAAMVEGSSLLLAMTDGLRALGRWSGDRGENLLDTGSPFYDVYPCADGQYVAVGALEPQFFTALVAELGLGRHPAFADQHDRGAWPRMREELAATFRSRTRAEWLEVFAGVDACVSPVLSRAEAAAHPHHRERRSFTTTASGALHPAPAPRFSASDPPPVADAAPFGRDAREILAEAGLTTDEVEDLLTRGAVVLPGPVAADVSPGHSPPP